MIIGSRNHIKEPLQNKNDNPFVDAQNPKKNK
jgi:hypothetical protein